MLLSNIYNRVNQLNRFHVVLLLSVLGFLTYANAVSHPFVHDDVVFIQQNPNLENLDLKDIFFQGPGIKDNPSFLNKYYRPFLELVNRLLYRVVRRNPHGFHFFNILLHILNSFLVYNVIRFVTGNKKRVSLAVAVLFLLHPVQSEAVACISGISNLVFAFLCLASFYGYLVSVHSESRKRSQVLYAFSLTLFFLALLSKEQSVILPFLIVAYELCFAGVLPKIFWRKYQRIAGFFIVLGGYFFLRKIFLGIVLTPVMTGNGELWMRMLAIPRSLLIYLSLMFFPHDLHYYRSQDILLPFVWPLLSILIVIAIIILLVWRTSQPQKRWMIFGLSWFMISLLPTLNIVPLVNEYSIILTAEHFLYFPLIGMILFALGAGCYWIEQKGNKKYFSGLVISMAISIIFMGMTIKQNTYWRGEIPLFERTLQFEKDFGRVHLLLAKAYFSEGRFEEATDEGWKALAIIKGYIQKITNEEVKEFYMVFARMIHYHLWRCFDALGDLEGALVQSKEALKLGPEDEGARYAVGLTHLKMGDIPNAIVHFEKIVEQNENDLMVMNSLAICYQEIGNDEKAEELLRKIVERDSRSVSAKQNLENFLRKKDTAEF